MRRRCSSAVVACLLVCANCAGPVSRLPQLPETEIKAEQRTEQIAQIRDYFAQLHQVDTVAFRIRTANTADCKKWVSAQVGLYAVTPQSLPRKFRSFGREALDLTWARPTVISVVEGSPAAQAGIVKGDEIIALNGELIPVTGTDGWIGAWLKHNGVRPVRVNLRNDGVDRTVMVTPVMACAVPIDYVVADEVNAQTDGNKIVVNSSILRVAKTEAQLALIVGHELAHVNLGHLQKQRMNSFTGMAGGMLVDATFYALSVPTGGVFTREFQKAGARAFSVGFEREADYVGAYYAARAGYNLAGAEEVWRSLSLLSPDSIRFAKTHPTTPMRFIQMQKVAAEIAEKEGHGLPLDPELRIINAEAQPPMNSGEEIR